MNLLNRKLRPQRSKVSVVDEFEYERGCARARIRHGVHEVDDEGTALDCLKYLDFASNFEFLNWFQNFNDNLFVFPEVNSSENFRITTSTEFHGEFIVILRPKYTLYLLIIVISIA